MERIGPHMPASIMENTRSHRDRIELLRSRVTLLSGHDRLLMTMYLENGNTFYQMAKLSGVNEATISRRIARITRRLLDGAYIVCLGHRDKFSREQMELAKDYFMRGMSLRQIASRRGSSC